MLLRANFELMADYNRWMNRRLYDAAATLDPATLAEDRGAFFRSILGTLNHLLVGDTIWLKRFADHACAWPSLDPVRAAPAPTSLDQILHPDLAGCRAAREALDEVIVAWSREVTDADLAGELEYANSRGDRFANPLGRVVHHFYNHQTHHRGQATTLLTQCGADIGATDLLVLIRGPT